MSEGTGVLLFLAIIVVGSLLIVSGVVAVSIFVFRAIGRTRQQTVRALASRPARQGEEFLSSAPIRPWTDDAWADLSSRWEGWWENRQSIGRADGYAQGVIRSLQDPDGPGWVAFTIQRQQMRNGLVVVQTSERRATLQVRAENWLDPNVEADAWIDNSKAGTIAVSYPACSFRGADNATGASWSWSRETRSREGGGALRPINRHLQRDEVNYDALEVNGRTIAGVADTWIRYPHPESDEAYPPALQSVTGDLTAAEQQVLLIALGLSLYYDSVFDHVASMRRRGAIYDW